MIGTLLLAFASCKKSPGTIGNNLVSDNNYIGVYHTDTAVIACHSYQDSVNTTKTMYSLLGSMNDPIFGTTEAGFYTQFRLSVAGQSFGILPILDSLVLQLCVEGYYGDTTVMQTPHAYVLTDSLSTEKSYYNHSSVMYEAIDVADDAGFMPRPKTKAHIIGTDTVRHAILRIPLRDELGEYLLNLDSTAYSQPDFFKKQFKGLYVTCEPVSQVGAITTVNLTDNTYTLLQLYYHNAATPDKKMRYDFHVTSSDVYFNHFDHDYSQGSAEFVDQLLNGNEEAGQQRIYVQSMGGVRTRISFPFMEQWADTLEHCHMVINEAKLVLPVVEWSVDSTFPAPSTMVLLGFNSDSTTYLLPDYLEGGNYFGGTYNSSNKTVTFRISEYMQNIVSRKREDFGLTLGINGASYNAQRVLINGPESADERKMRLEVTYSLVTE